MDSIISLHRSEFLGRGNLSERQQKLNGSCTGSRGSAEIYNVVVIITNQVQSTPDTFFGDPQSPLEETSSDTPPHTGIYLRKAGKERKAINDR